MKTTLAILVVTLSVWSGYGQPTVFPPASQTQVNAGTSANTFVSPKTLAGLGIGPGATQFGGLNTNNVNTNNASTLSSGTIPLVVENPVVITNSTPTVNFGALTLGFGSTSPNGISFNAGGDTLPFIGPSVDGDGVLFNCSFGSSYFNGNGSLVGDGTMLTGVGLLASKNLWAGSNVFSGGLYGLAQGVVWTNGSATPFLANGTQKTVPASGIITLSMTITNAETVFLTNTTSGDCAILGPISSLTTTAAGVFGMITVTSGDVVEITNVAVTAQPVIIRCQFHAFR